MKNKVAFLFLVILTVIPCVFSPFVIGAYAALVRHHGHMVESEGSSQDCLSCHDGALASNTAACTVRCNAVTSHSIDMDYPPVKDRNSYAPAEEVEARGVRILKGKMTCISCHNLANPGRLHLAVERPEVCLICHKGWYQR